MGTGARSPPFVRHDGVGSPREVRLDGLGLLEDVPDRGRHVSFGIPVRVPPEGPPDDRIQQPTRTRRERPDVEDDEPAAGPERLVDVLDRPFPLGGQFAFVPTVALAPAIPVSSVTGPEGSSVTGCSRSVDDRLETWVFG